MEFPLRWVYGAVRRSGQVQEFEAPGHAWVLNVRGYLSQIVDGQSVDEILTANAELLATHPALSWVVERRGLSLLNADTDWARWEAYMTELSVPGESGDEEPRLLVDVERQVLYMVPDREILPMRLEEGLPAGWSWRTVTRSELQEILTSSDHVEHVLGGASNQVAQAALRRAQRSPKQPREASTGSDQTDDRVKAIIRRRVAVASEKGG